MTDYIRSMAFTGDRSKSIGPFDEPPTNPPTHDAATVEACARIADETAARHAAYKADWGAGYTNAGRDTAKNIRALPTTTAGSLASEDVALPYLADRFEWAAPGDQQEDAWIVRFLDKDCREAVFTGPDAEREAWEHWNRYAPSYNLYVFRLARLASAPTDVALIDAAETAYDLARDAIGYRGRRAEYAIWAERYGRDLLALARLASTPTDAAPAGDAMEALRIAEAVGQADASFGYNLQLTQLVDGETTYTLTIEGVEPREYDDREDALLAIDERRAAHRANAIRAALAVSRPTRGDGV